MNIELSQEVQHEYRAWDIRNSKMVYDALKLMEVQQLVTVNADYFNSPFSFFDGCKWMMSTGELDFNKKKVFEGDLLKSTSDRIGEVKFGKSDNGWVGFFIEWENGNQSGFMNIPLTEVVGNIYEKI